jgi:hypothetical protein
VLKTAKGLTLEAVADLTPGQALSYSTEEIGGLPVGFVILGAGRRELLRFPIQERDAGSSVPSFKYPDREPVNPDSLLGEPATRYWGALLNARNAFRAGAYAEADQFLETALLFDGDDHLAWIEKAIALRLAGVESEDAPELPNAHFLAPLEPMLRAESFLSQSGLDGKAFFEPLADAPNALIECACVYAELGLFEECARFIDAARSVSDLPMLCFLYAYCCVATDRLQTDAASAVGGVKRLEPPYPWRPIERIALETLTKTFPTNEILAQYLQVFEMQADVTKT